MKLKNCRDISWFLFIGENNNLNSYFFEDFSNQSCELINNPLPNSRCLSPSPHWQRTLNRDPDPFQRSMLTSDILVWTPDPQNNTLRELPFAHYISFVTQHSQDRFRRFTEGSDSEFSHKFLGLETLMIYRIFASDLASHSPMRCSLITLPLLALAVTVT